MLERNWFLLVSSIILFATGAIVWGFWATLGITALVWAWATLNIIHEGYDVMREIDE